MKFTTQFLLMLLSLFISTNIYSKEAIKTCDELLSDNQYEEALKTKKGEFKSTFCHGQVNLRLKNFDEAIKNFKLAGRLSKSDTDHFMADLLVGMALKEARRLDDALIHLNNSYSFIKANKTFKRLYLVEIAETLLLLSKYDEAVNTFLEAYAFAANDEERASNLDRTAFSYALLKNYTKAVEYELKANMAFDRTGLLGEYVESGINLALYYSEANDQASAERTLLKFEKFSRENGGMYYLAKVLFTQSNYYKKKSNMDLSKSKLDEANKIANDIGAEDLKTLFKTL